MSLVHNCDDGRYQLSIQMLNRKLSDNNEVFPGRTCGV